MKCCYLEIYWKKKWRWAGTYYARTFKSVIKSAVHAANSYFDGELDDWRIKLGEPK